MSMSPQGLVVQLPVGPLVRSHTECRIVGSPIVTQATNSEITKACFFHYLTVKIWYLHAASRARAGKVPISLYRATFLSNVLVSMRACYCYLKTRALLASSLPTACSTVPTAVRHSSHQNGTHTCTAGAQPHI